MSFLFRPCTSCRGGCVRARARVCLCLWCARALYLCVSDIVVVLVFLWLLREHQQSHTCNKLTHAPTCHRAPHWQTNVIGHVHSSLLCSSRGYHSGATRMRSRLQSHSPLNGLAPPPTHQLLTSELWIETLKAAPPPTPSFPANTHLADPSLIQPFGGLLSRCPSLARLGIGALFAVKHLQLLC